MAIMRHRLNTALFTPPYPNMMKKRAGIDPQFLSIASKAFFIDSCLKCFQVILK